ncbi:chorismate synthase [Neobittarella massiliensis]|uniref:Chorismate synthase n=1 Tax=Neobittarella massiliensis (ex Bilen et al. 2018) TaxID=2041842 RepID=A0A8J6LZJ2_9FIRM|nr:chorismate synthase [Neobittarella massiliensis]MBC3516783.1 chorismate synthase [Neobittarella massiliensis]
MSSSYGSKFKISLFGESHGPAIGVVIEGVRPGLVLDWAHISAFCARRLAKNSWSTPRREPDTPKILSGVVDGVACGTPICAVIENQNTRSQDYGPASHIARPGHADYTGYVKYSGHNDVRGGGHFSARLTAPLVFAGAIATQMLAEQGIYVGAHIAHIAGIADTPFDPVAVSRQDFEQVHRRDFPVCDSTAGEQMIAAIDAARRDGDSVGGVIECAVIGLPAGIGDPIFGSVESTLAAMLYAIPAVKGVSFGNGFAGSMLRGSQNNDPFTIKNGQVRTTTNRAGGIQGGITNAMPVLMQVAFKPTPSIAKEQQTIDFVQGTVLQHCIQGRHDPCVVPRAAVCVEAGVAIALLNML